MECRDAGASLDDDQKVNEPLWYGGCSKGGHEQCRRDCESNSDAVQSGGMMHSVSGSCFCFSCAPLGPTSCPEALTSPWQEVRNRQNSTCFLLPLALLKICVEHAPPAADKGTMSARVYHTEPTFHIRPTKKRPKPQTTKMSLMPFLPQRRGRRLSQ